MESTNKDKFKHIGLAVLAVVAVLVILGMRDGDAPSPALYVLGAAGGLAFVFGAMKDSSNLTSIKEQFTQQMAAMPASKFRVFHSEGKSHSLVSIFDLIVKDFGGDVATQLKGLLSLLKSFGKPVYFSGTISWGKGKTYPIVLGKNPEDN